LTLRARDSRKRKEMATAKLLLETMRPRQWIKNLLVFAGIFYAGMIDKPVFLLKVTIAFAVFCALSGSVYIVNDIRDVEQDKRHPLKCRRPIASGRLATATAWRAAVSIAAVALVVAFVISTRFGLCAVAYIVLGLAYSFVLKSIVIVDLITLALGFVLRAYAGTQVVSVEVTPWFLECILFLALFIAICKRRHELVLLNEGATKHRKVLREYSVGFLDQMVSVATTAALLSYALWTTAPQTREKFDGMIVTVPFVLYGIFRYLYLVYYRKEGGAPEALILTDRSLLINIFLWFLVVLFLVYKQRITAWLPPGWFG